MVVRTDPRLHFAGRHSTLIDELRLDGGFESLAQVAVFSAALGQNRGRKSDRSNSQYDVRFSVLQTLPGGEELINAIAIANAPLPIVSDPLSEDKLDERLRLFEEFVNGGLDVVSETIQNDGNAIDIVFGIMNSAIAEFPIESES
jgi:dnd system-associated protein 4